MTFTTSTANQQDFSKETSTEEPIVAPFVQKTYDLVSDPSTDHIISWSPDGKTFFIHQLHLLQLEILPQYFKHNNACSFIRQLNTYGFRKVIKSTARRPSSSAPDRIEFGHPFFYKDGASKLVLIVRKKSKKRKLSEMEDSSSSCQFSRSCDDVEDLLLRPINNKEVAEEVKQLKHDNQVLAKALLTLSKDHQSTLQLLSKLSQEIDSLKTSLAGNSPNSFHSSYDSESDTEHEESAFPPAKRQKLSPEQSFLDTFSTPTSLPRSILDFAPFDLQDSAESFESESSSSAASPADASYVENYPDQAFPVPGFSYLCKMDYSENSGQVGGYCSVPIM